MDLVGKKQKVFQVKRGGYVNPVISTSETQGLTDSQQTITLGYCPWGEVLHDMSEVKALCWRCGNPICAKHENVICVICERVTCKECISDNKTRVAKGIVCIAHSTWQVMLYVSRNRKSSRAGKTT